MVVVVLVVVGFVVLDVVGLLWLSLSVLLVGSLFLVVSFLHLFRSCSLFLVDSYLWEHLVVPLFLLAGFYLQCSPSGC